MASNNSDWGSSGGSMGLNVASGANFDLRVGTVIVNSLTGSGTVGTTFSSTPILTVGGNNGSSTFNGVIQNTLSLAGTTAGGTVYLTKTGTGSFTLTGNNSYGGYTLVNGGVLNISGTINHPGNDFGIAYTSGGNSVVNVTGSVTAGHVYIGSTAGA